MIEEYLKQLYFCNGHKCGECQMHSGVNHCLITDDFVCPDEAPEWFKNIVIANKICETIPNSTKCEKCKNYKTCPVITYKELALDFAYNRNQPVIDDSLLLQILTKI